MHTIETPKVRISPVNKLFHLLLVTILTCIAFNSYAAKNYEKKYERAVAAYNNKKYNSAYWKFKYLARKGHVRGQYWLGMLYTAGKGVFRNQQKAFRWF